MNCRFLGFTAISRPDSKRTRTQPGGQGATAMLGWITWPIMPLSSALRMRFASITFFSRAERAVKVFETGLKSPFTPWNRGETRLGGLGIGLHELVERVLTSGLKDGR